MCHRWEFDVDFFSQADKKERKKKKSAQWSHIGLIWHERFFDFFGSRTPIGKDNEGWYKASHMSGRM